MPTAVCHGKEARRLAKDFQVECGDGHFPNIHLSGADVRLNGGHVLPLNCVERTSQWLPRMLMRYAVMRLTTRPRQVGLGTQ